MAPKKGAEPVAAAPVSTDSTGLPLFSDEAVAAEAFSLEAPYEDALGATLPTGLSAGMLTWRRPSEFLADLLVEPEEGAEPVTPCIVQPPPPPPEGAEAQPPPRALPNALVAEAPAEALPTVQWLASCFHFVELQNVLLEEGTFLWELIYPKAADGVTPAYNPSGKYAVRLFEQGAWRMVVVDDRMPFVHGTLLVPSSASRLELWPMILAKALYKLSESYPTAVSQDPAVLLRLTSWLPEVVPISPSLPAYSAWEVIDRYNERSPYDRMAACALMLPSGDDEGLGEVGLCHGPLVAVLDAREVNGELYTRLESQLFQWAGAPARRARTHAHAHARARARAHAGRAL